MSHEPTERLVFRLLFSHKNGMIRELGGITQ